MTDDETWSVADDIMLQYHARGRDHPGAVAAAVGAGLLQWSSDEQMDQLVTPATRGRWDWDAIREFFLEEVPDVAVSGEGVAVTEERDIATVRILANQPELRIGTGGPGSTVDVVAWFVVVWNGPDVGWLLHAIAYQPVKVADVDGVPRPAIATVPSW